MITFRITTEELAILNRAAAKADRTQTDMVREWIRSLESGKRGAKH
jgi:hypothetical protein